MFSNLSLAFKPEFDLLAGLAYTLVVVLDSVVVLLAIILNPRARRRRMLQDGCGDVEEPCDVVVPCRESTSDTLSSSVTR